MGSKGRVFPTGRQQGEELPGDLLGHPPPESAGPRRPVHTGIGLGLNAQPGPEPSLDGPYCS